jgi:hypothetical protein
MTVERIENMNKPSWKTLAVTTSFVLMLVAGCGQKEAPDFKQTRAIAAENIELRKELNRQDARFANLKKQYDKELQKQRELLEKCEQERDEWKTKARNNVREQVQGVLDSVMADNAKLREENAKLKAQLEELKE